MTENVDGEVNIIRTMRQTTILIEFDAMMKEIHIFVNNVLL